jgi:hypothetical protein
LIEGALLDGLAVNVLYSIRLGLLIYLLFD